MKIIIVLGCKDRVKLKTRVDRALSEFFSEPYYDTETQKPNTMLLFSGGSTNDNTRTECEIMIEQCKETVDSRFIMSEPKSLSTVENILYSKQVIEHNWMDKVEPRPSLVVCTSTFHIKRTIIIAKLLMPEYDIKFIHTNEDISHDEQKREHRNILAFVDYYVNKLNIN